MPVAAFDAFVAPARRRPQIWRLLLGLGVALAVYVAVMAVVLVLGLGLLGIDPAQIAAASDADDAMPPALERLILGQSPTAMLILLATFAGMALGPVVAVSLLHARRPDTLLGPRAALLHDFAVAAAVTLAVAALGVGISSALDLGPRPSRALDLSLWLAILPVALVGVAVQTGAEEVLFRGYLMQQLAARFGSPLVWIGVPTILFGLAHYAPPQNGDNTWLIVLATGTFGLAAADLTIRTGSLGAAWGFHFANNCIALLVVSVQGPLSGLALYLMPFGSDDTEVLRPLLVLDVISVVAIWATIRAILSRRRPRAA